jgi:hypothetical protein
MRKFIFILFILSFSKIQAQTYFGFPDSNAVWNTYYADVFYGHNINPYFIKGDTTVNGRTYTKVYQSADTFVNPLNCNFYCMVRDSNQQWLFFNFMDQSETVLYDFSLEEGDSIVLNSNGTSFVSYVYQVDSILLAGQYRKRMYMSADINTIEWIEGIGSSRGLIVPYSSPSCGGYGLMCFQENDILVFSGPDSICWFSEYVNNVGTEIVEFGHGLKIYPNPAKDIITVDGFNESLFGEPILVRDLMGRTLIKNIINSTNQSINIDHLTAGVYTIAVKDRVFKFIKH